MTQVPAITVAELQQRIKQGAAPVVIDVREPSEFEICHLEGSKLIPLGSLPERLADIPRDQPVVVHCHHGGRSARAVAFLQEQGYDNVTNLSGGIHDWATQIDPSMRTY